MNGRAVAPADLAASKVPMPDAIAVPLHAGSRSHPPGPRQTGDVPYVTLDGRRLEPLINPRPCR